MNRLAKLTLRAGFACLTYGVAVEPKAFRVRRCGAKVLDPGSEPVRILHLSDVHLLTRQRHKLGFLAALRGLEPDFVVSTGDNLSSPDALAALVEAMDGLLDIPGAFVFGSNDFHKPHLRNPLEYMVRATSGDHAADPITMQPEALREAFAARGWFDLNNARVQATVRGIRFDLRGTGDAHEDRDDYASVSGPAAPGTVPLGLTHAPYRRVLDAMADDSVRLIFAGHTHGGQVRIPGFGAVVSNCDLPPAHARGLFRHESSSGSSWVNVSAGMGMSPFAPYRFACPPEVTLLTLCPAE